MKWLLGCLLLTALSPKCPSGESPAGVSISYEAADIIAIARVESIRLIEDTTIDESRVRVRSFSYVATLQLLHVLGGRAGKRGLKTVRINLGSFQEQRTSAGLTVSDLRLPRGPGLVIDYAKPSLVVLDLYTGPVVSDNEQKAVLPGGEQGDPFAVLSRAAGEMAIIVLPSYADDWGQCRHGFDVFDQSPVAIEWHHSSVVLTSTKVGSGGPKREFDAGVPLAP